MATNLTRGCFLLKRAHINVSRSAAPKLALVTANRYNCGVSIYTLMPLSSFIRIERDSDGGPCHQT